MPMACWCVVCPFHVLACWVFWACCVSCPCAPGSGVAKNERALLLWLSGVAWVGFGFCVCWCPFTGLSPVLGSTWFSVGCVNLSWFCVCCVSGVHFSCVGLVFWVCAFVHGHIFPWCGLCVFAQGRICGCVSRGGNRGILLQDYAHMLSCAIFFER